MIKFFSFFFADLFRDAKVIGDALLGMFTPKNSDVQGMYPLAGNPVLDGMRRQAHRPDVYELNRSADTHHMECDSPERKLVAFILEYLDTHKISNVDKSVVREYLDQQKDVITTRFFYELRTGGSLRLCPLTCDEKNRAFEKALNTHCIR